MNTAQNSPLIVGAGPVGLAAALFLANAGIFRRMSRLEVQQAEHALAEHEPAGKKQNGC